MEDFGDLLEDIRNDGGEFMWITKKKTFLENQSNKKRSPETIKLEVLKSQTIRHAIDQLLATSPELRREDILKEAQEIIDEMAHQFDLKYVRLLGYTLMKVFCKIYKHIYYNKDMTSNLEVLKHAPCLMLPLHRSYMDFLLVSIICFHKNVQMPAIATGMDFMGLSFLSQLIRRAGGFFIRRSFGSDKLYWAVFNEYVQAHLLNCDRPLEFFIEGTRSRTSKSLPPKHGMLASCLELYLKEHRVFDIYLCPISLTYERLLEETLYSSELLGIPKPKESVGGLVKARAILGQSYGSIFVNFARPLSFREMIFHLKGGSGLYPSLTPNFVFELKPNQVNMIQSVSYTVLLEMLRSQIIQPISLMATCLLSAEKYSTSLDTLAVWIEELRRMLTNLGCRVYWSETSTQQIILENLRTHSNLFDLCNAVNKSADFEENLRLASESGSSMTSFIVRMKQISRSSELTQAHIFEEARLFLAVCSYRNQLVSFLVRKSFACNSILAMSVHEQDLVFREADANGPFESYQFLTRLFSREFIFQASDVDKDFEDSLKHMVHTNLLQRNNGRFELTKFNLEKFLFLAQIFMRFMQNYCGVYSILVGQERSCFSDEKEVIKLVQSQVFEKMLSKECYDFDLEILSLNLISNSVLVLRQFGILSGDRQKTSQFSIDLSQLKDLNLRLVKIVAENKQKLKILATHQHLAKVSKL